MNFYELTTIKHEYDNNKDIKAYFYVNFSKSLLVNIQYFPNDFNMCTIDNFLSLI